MKRHFNTHLEGLDLQFWHDLIESRGKLVSLRKGEYLCRKGEPTNVCGYVKSGYFKYTVDGTKKIGGFAFPEALVGDYPYCMDNAPAMFDIVAGKNSEAWIIDATILPKLFEEDIEAGRQGRLFMQSAYVSLINRYYARYVLGPRPDGCTLFVPFGCSEAYKASEKWSQFKIEEMPEDKWWEMIPYRFSLIESVQFPKFD